jgi:quinol monooxygenase YgiN
MWRASALTTKLFGLAVVAVTTFRSVSLVEHQPVAPRYLRVSVAHWNINLSSPEAERIFHQIDTDGIAVFRAQPGFIRYRLMRADSTTTIAVAEWESEALGKVGAEHYRAWMRSVGIMDRITLDTHAGDIAAGS